MYYSNLLKAKHWQLFLIVYGLPLLYQLVLVVDITLNAVRNNNMDIEMILNYSKFSSLIILVFVLLFLYWFFVVGIGLNNKLSVQLKLHTNRFKFCLLLIAAYFVIISIGISIFMNSWGSNININTYADNTTIFTILALFSFLSMFIMFCFFFSFRFVAKIIKTTELQEKVYFSDYIGEFLLVCLLFPIGIWFIQPRINKIANA